MTVSIPYSTLSLEDLLDNGAAAVEAERAAYEAAHKGELRGGNAGSVDDDGNVYGNCHRVAYARWLGLERAVSPEADMYMSAGEACEGVVKRRLQTWLGGLASAEDSAVAWTFRDDGKDWTVSGRPDMLLVDAAGKPVVGVELKSIWSGNGAMTVGLQGKPSNAHLVQSAHYMAKLNVPYVLVYWSPAKHNTIGVGKRFGYSASAYLPFKRVFYLSLKDGRLHYRNGYRNGNETATNVTLSGIEKFYKLVATMARPGNTSLGPRVTSEHVTGAAKSYDQCKYCEFNRACVKYEADKVAWTDAVKMVCDGYEI